MSSCSHARALELQIASLVRRVDGLEAAVGEIRAQLRARFAGISIGELEQRVATLELAIGADVDVGGQS